MNAIDMTISNDAIKTVTNYFEVLSAGSGNVVIKVLNIQGKVAKTVRQTVEDGLTNFRLNIEDLRKGKYVINVFNDNDFVKAVYYTKS